MYSSTASPRRSSLCSPLTVMDLQLRCRRCGLRAQVGTVVRAAREGANAVLLPGAVDAQLEAALAEANADIVLLEPAHAEDELVRRQRRHDERRREAHRRRVLLVAARACGESVRQRGLACCAYDAAVRERDALTRWLQRDARTAHERRIDEAKARGPAVDHRLYGQLHAADSADAALHAQQRRRFGARAVQLQRRVRFHSAARLVRGVPRSTVVGAMPELGEPRGHTAARAWLVLIGADEQAMRRRVRRRQCVAAVRLARGVPRSTLVGAMPELGGPRGHTAAGAWLWRLLAGEHARAWRCRRQRMTTAAPRRPLVDVCVDSWARAARAPGARARPACVLLCPYGR